MGRLIINNGLVTPEKAEALVSLCPFGAISYENGKIDISSGCKMCKMCVRKGQGLVSFEEDKKEVDKSLWKGICVYADCSDGKLHSSSDRLASYERDEIEKAKKKYEKIAHYVATGRLPSVYNEASEKSAYAEYMRVLAKYAGKK